MTAMTGLRCSRLSCLNRTAAADTPNKTYKNKTLVRSGLIHFQLYDKLCSFTIVVTI